MSSILLTGGTGYIGSHTAVELLGNGFDVVIADNLYNSEAEVIDHIEEITGKRPAFYQIDVSDKDAVKKIFEENEICAVMHFAGYKAVGESMKDPLAYYRNNLDTALTLLEAMTEYGVRMFIFSSSATVYNRSETIPYVETDQNTGCVNPYGWTKYMIEEIMKDTANAYPDMSMIALRYFNPIGAHQSGLIGEKPNGIPNNLMPYITQVASGKREILHIFGSDYPTPDGTGVRDYIHVVDLAKGHLAALRYCMADQSGYEIFNLGTGCGVSVLELVHTFEKVNGIKVPYEMTDRRPGDIAEYYADPSKANSILKWHAELGIDDMCRDAWRWEQRQK